MISRISENERIVNAVIILTSVLIPSIVFLLIFSPQSGKLGDFDVRFLPHLNAVLNSSVSFSLIIAFLAIKNKNYRMHRNMMLSAVFLSCIFLISYLVYHFQSEQLFFGDADFNKIVDEKEKSAVGFLRPVYFFVLLTHIVLSVVVVPLVLFALFFAFGEQRQKHRKIVRFAYPLWLYVAVSGVSVYLFMLPYYPSL
jgi:putative membrane protein